MKKRNVKIVVKCTDPKTNKQIVQINRFKYIDKDPKITVKVKKISI